MILRRIKAHVENENWFAVGIDFFIVVFGVFMGFQVNNWNEARSDRVDNQRYMQRLHDEIERSDTQSALVSNELETTVRRVNEVIDILYGNEPVQQLTRDHCDAIFASHIYRPGRVSIPTLEELLSSGRASVISDVPLRNAILHLSQLRQATDDFINRISSNVVELHRKYPEMISLNREITYDRFGSAPYGGHSCSPALMREDLGFRNDLIDNLYRMDSYVVMANKPEIEVFKDIHISLDRILGLEHEAGTAQ